MSKSVTYWLQECRSNAFDWKARAKYGPSILADDDLCCTILYNKFKASRTKLPWSEFVKLNESIKGESRELSRLNGAFATSDGTIYGMSNKSDKRIDDMLHVRQYGRPRYYEVTEPIPNVSKPLHGGAYSKAKPLAKPWTDKENALLLKVYKKMADFELTALFGRSKNSCRKQYARLLKRGTK